MKWILLGLVCGLAVLVGLLFIIKSPADRSEVTALLQEKLSLSKAQLQEAKHLLADRDSQLREKNETIEQLRNMLAELGGENSSHAAEEAGGSKRP